jgi:hypothetical protein
LKEAERKMEIIRLELLTKGYATDRIFNIDEAPLFYKALPTRTYEFVANPDLDKRQVGRGVKSLRALSLLYYVAMRRGLKKLTR